MFYNIKLFEYDGTFKQTVNTWLLKDDAISFSSDINASVGSLSIILDLPLANMDFAVGNVIQIHAYSDIDKTGKLIYTGGINSINRNANNAREQIELNCLGLLWFFARFFFRDPMSGTTIFTLTDEPADILKEIIDQMNTFFPWSWVSYSGGLIQNFGSNIDVSFNFTNAADAIKAVLTVTKWDLFIRPGGQVVFRPTPATPTHLLKYKRHVDEMDIDETSDDMVNNYFLSGNTGGGTYTDATSISDYGIFELAETISALNGQPTVDATGNSTIDERKNPLRNITLTLNPRYNILSINPWDTLTVLNTDYSIRNVKVIKTEYKSNRLVVRCERFLGVGRKIINTINWNS